MEEKYSKILPSLLSSTATDPIEIQNSIMNESFVSPNGPEHHFIDGGSFLAAIRNSGYSIDLEECLDKLMERSMKMPGAMCGLWGVFGAAASLGAALSILNCTSPLSTDNGYKDNMELTSSIISRMSSIGGARCCKRNAYISLQIATGFVREKYGIEINIDKPIVCSYSQNNRDCIGNRCPYHKK